MPIKIQLKHTNWMSWLIIRMLILQITNTKTILKGFRMSLEVPKINAKCKMLFTRHGENQIKQTGCICSCQWIKSDCWLIHQAPPDIDESRMRKRRTVHSLLQKRTREKPRIRVLHSRNTFTQFPDTSKIATTTTCYKSNYSFSHITWESLRLVETPKEKVT